MDLNFEYYKVFYYVSKYGSLTRAANVLMTSQPAVTRTIHNLESELGCRLFIRSKKGVELTPEGRVFYEYISAACAQIFKGENELASMVGLENGTICISATETALHCCLFQAVEQFTKEYPEVRFKLLNNSTAASIQALKTGKADLAVVSSDPAAAPPCGAIRKSSSAARSSSISRAKSSPCGSWRTALGLAIPPAPSPGTSSTSTFKSTACPSSRILSSPPQT